MIEGVAIIARRDLDPAAKQEDRIRHAIGPAVDLRRADRAVILVPGVLQLEVGAEAVGRVPVECQAPDEVGQPAFLIDRRGARLEQLEFVDIVELRGKADAEGIGDRAGNIPAEEVTLSSNS